MGDSKYLFSVSLTWNQGPQKLKKLKNKLQAYFQSKNKSDGGECEIRDTDCSRGYVLIYFEDETGKPTPKKEKGSPSCLSSAVLIENLQDNCTPEIINLLVENISGKTMDTDFHIERIPEIQAAVITFTCDIDTANFIGKFSSNQKVQQRKLTAKSLEDTRTVRVEGIPPSTLEDMVTLYFESKKNGGGSVEDMVILSDENAALVTFHQAEAIPDSVEIPICPHILEFILKDAQIKLNVEKAMADVYCDITWPNVDQPSPVIKLSFPMALSSHLRTLAKILPTWNHNIHKEFELLISKYKVIECDLKPPVWEAIKEKISSSSYDGLLIKPVLGAEKAYIVGISEEVMKIEPIFRNLVEGTTRQLSRVVEDVRLEPAAYELMIVHGLEKSILEDCPHVKIGYDGASETIKLHGPKDQVLTAKCEILNTLQGLKSKLAHLDPHIIQFLKAADNKELSCSLLTSKNIRATFQVEDNAVMITGYSDKDLRNAEETLIKELVCKRISVEDKSVTQSPAWESLKSNLKDGGGINVTIEEFPVGDGNEVVIAGLSSAAQETYQQIHDFVEKNTMVQKAIKLKSVAVVQFMEEERSQEWKRISQNVKVAKKQSFISLSGPKLYVEEAETGIRKMISNLCSDTLHSTKPGVKKFFLENEDMYVTTVRQNHKCVIQLQKEVDENISHLGEPHCQVSLQNGATMTLYKGDLCQHNAADVIIIASNKTLKPTGAPALAVVEAAGPNLQKECKSIVQKEGELEPGECVITDAGNLQCKKMIHALGPKWDKRGNSKCERLLRKAITRSLKMAAENGQSSVVLSVGDFVTSGCPLDLCVENIVKSIKSYTESQEGANTIKNIHLVENDDDILKTIMEFLNEEFEEKNVQVTRKHGMKKQKKKTQKQGEMTDKVDDQAVATIEGLNIDIKQGNIADATTNVIVNSVGRNLNLRSGAVSNALFKKAGNNLQDLLKTERKGRQVEDGSIFVTDGCNLSSDIVIHAVVPHWDRGDGSSAQILRNIMRDCLSTTESKHYSSITIPAMGTGILGFPRNTVAAIMFEEILEFSSKNKPQHLKQVNLILHPSDEETIKVFTSELEKKISTGGQKKEIKPQSFFGNVKSPAQNFYEMKVGSVTYQVKTGDITKETCDVIINISNNVFTLKSGVSKAILDGAGPNIESESARLGTQPNNGYVVTRGGNLSCKNIIHVAGQTKPQDIKQCVTNALQECERRQATSVAFPAMGTGAGGASSAAVADAILDAVVDFVKSKSVITVQNVMVVIFQQQMLKDFHDSMKKKESPTAPTQQSWNFFSRIKSFFGGSQSDKNNEGKEEEEEEEEVKVFVLRENIEPAIFHLCAESRESVNGALDWLQGLITKEQSYNTITDSWIQDFDDENMDFLAELQKTNGVCVTFDSPQSTIKVTGRNKDVLKVIIEIQKKIKSVRDKKTQEREAELCSNVVEWGYHEGTNFVPFDKITNLDLEKADNDNGSVKVFINDVQYTAIAELRSACDAKGNKVTLRRHSKNAESLEIPPYWDAMDNTQLKVVLLNNSSPDYSEVVGLFTQTCQMRIIKIERIQNKHLYQNYRIKKNSIDTKNGTRTNEKRLFHGTEFGPTESINRNGFNRAYAGANATKLGKGTYFAVEANYSADDTYSKPHTDGYKYMYLARVLTGVYCAGHSTMITPPAKSTSNPTDMYDSVTDNGSRPTVFVIFNDIQAYPEYLITFTK
ncbi:PREDICTED: poly [ADP-ribose] polymerase 14-like [Nanorana parkeri]|uniref:poly [ADP-ribose] polymerase 14-like n=1 Tax=Nanorana parkeri TaxID=125878 RepID=UPI0008546405|nr:PREDICTED: poly [ADP-ribose] polymerase 14-like [Nanorana parkeri]